MNHLLRVESARVLVEQEEFVAESRDRPMLVDESLHCCPSFRVCKNIHLMRSAFDVHEIRHHKMCKESCREIGTGGGMGEASGVPQDKEVMGHSIGEKAELGEHSADVVVLISCIAIDHLLQDAIHFHFQFHFHFRCCCCCVCGGRCVVFSRLLKRPLVRRNEISCEMK